MPRLPGAGELGLEAGHAEVEVLGALRRVVEAQARIGPALRELDRGAEFSCRRGPA